MARNRRPQPTVAVKPAAKTATWTGSSPTAPAPRAPSFLHSARPSNTRSNRCKRETTAGKPTHSCKKCANSEKKSTSRRKSFKTSTRKCKMRSRSTSRRSLSSKRHSSCRKIKLRCRGSWRTSGARLSLRLKNQDASSATSTSTSS